MYTDNLKFFKSAPRHITLQCHIYCDLGTKPLIYCYMAMLQLPAQIAFKSRTHTISANSFVDKVIVGIKSAQIMMLLLGAISS